MGAAAGIYDGGENGLAYSDVNRTALLRFKEKIVMSDDAQRIFNRLKMVGGKFPDEAAALHELKDLLHEAALKGNLGRKFIEGYNIALTKAADIIGWGEERTELRNQVLDLRVTPPKREE